MTFTEKYVLFLAVISLQMSLYSTSFISQIIKGSLTDVQNITLSLFVEDFRGIILYSFDSFKNQFGMTIKNKKNILLNYNKEYKDYLLKSACGCDPCDRRMMKFNFVISRGMILVICNNNSALILNTKPIKNKQTENMDKVIYSTPKLMLNASDSLYFMMGNIGPYIDENNINVFPLKDQMVGCLDKFFVNQQKINFNQTGMMMHSSCISHCSDNTCNGGRCMVRIKDNNPCDCTSTALNGPYCNRSMKMYKNEDNNSYEKVKGASFIYMKLTWRSMLDKVYCLLKIIKEDEEVKIWTNKTHLMKNNDVLWEINKNEINFININITWDYLVLNVKNKTLKFKMFLRSIIKINVGFCKRNKDYETLEGTYDFLFDSSQLKILESLSKLSSKKSQITNKSEKKDINFPLILSLVTIFFIIIFAVIITVLYLRGKKEMKQELNKITARSTFSIEPLNETFKETDLYGKVEDSIYDNIQ